MFLHTNPFFCLYVMNTREGMHMQEYALVYIHVATDLAAAIAMHQQYKEEDDKRGCDQCSKCSICMFYMLYI